MATGRAQSHHGAMSPDLNPDSSRQSGVLPDATPEWDGVRRVPPGTDPRPSDALPAAVVVVLGVPLAYATVLAAVYLLVPARPPSGGCEGLGFGCSLSARDGLIFVALVFAPRVVTGAYLVAGIAVGVARRGSKVAAAWVMVVVEAVVFGVVAGALLVATAPR